ncbi:MAG TPA: hypothetical protein VF700_10080, partial [Segetibacter sp.]
PMQKTTTNILIVEICPGVNRFIFDDTDNTKSKLTTALVNKQITDMIPATDPHFNDPKFLFLNRQYK